MLAGSEGLINALPAGLYEFFGAAQVHGAQVQGLQAQTPFPQPQDTGVQLHPRFCFFVVSMICFSFQRC